MRNFLKDKLTIFSIAAFTAVIIIFHKFPSYDISDFKTVYFLFLLFASTKSLEMKGSFERLAHLLSRKAGGYVLLMTALLSALVTNDVALTVVIPLTLSLNLPKAEEEKMVILEAILANGFSSLTPFGNPQNIFIHVHYSLSPLDIPLSIWPLPLTTLLLALLMCRVRVGDVRLPENGRGGLVDILMFSIVALAIADVIPDVFSIAPLVYYTLFERKALKSVDYPLLVAFLAFFGTTDVVSRSIGSFEISGFPLFATSVGLSQFLSNVPTALILADFTSDWKSLLWGVSVGGFGSLVASMANLIAYRLGNFSIKRFTLYNLLFLLLGVALFLAIFGF